METWRMAARRPGETLSYAWLSGASTYLDWVMPALLRCQGGGAFELRMVTALEQALEERQSAGAEAGMLKPSAATRRRAPIWSRRFPPSTPTSATATSSASCRCPNSKKCHI